MKAETEPPPEVSFQEHTEAIKKDFLAIEKIGWDWRRRMEERRGDERRQILPVKG